VKSRSNKQTNNFRFCVLLKKVLSFEPNSTVEVWLKRKFGRSLLPSPHTLSEIEEKPVLLNVLQLLIAPQAPRFLDFSYGPESQSSETRQTAKLASENSRKKNLREYLEVGRSDHTYFFFF
jgi:hypothetical protein